MRDSTLARLRKHYRLACAVLIALVLAPILLLTLPRSSSEAPSQRPAADMPLQAASLGLVLAQKLVQTFHMVDLNQLYTILFCVWFLLLGAIEFFVLRFVWRRWFSLAS